jgi:peptidoglycan hydrolase-like protein with peptidoglycan-binding domain
MAELPEALTHKIGPFPVYGWLAIGATGVGLGLVIRRSHLFGGAGAVAPVDSTIDGTGDPAAAGDIYTGGLPGGGGYAGSYNGPSTVPVAPQLQPVTPAVTTNLQWQNAAIQWATGHGLDPLGMSNAVGKYLNGEALSSTEASYVQQALNALGPPPEGAPSVDVSPAPSPTPLPVLPPTVPGPPISTPLPGTVVNTGGQTSVGGKTPPSVPFPGRVLRVTTPYMSGPDVSQWQGGYNARRLANEPAPLKVDGIYGPASADAARAIQRRAGLAIDGAVGPQTWNVTFYGSP